MNERTIWILLGALVLSACAPVVSGERSTLPTPSDVPGGAAEESGAPTPAFSSPLSPLETPGSESEPPGRPPADVPPGVALVYRRSGGFAGVSEEWVLTDDGRLTASGAGQWQTSPEQVAQLVDTIEALGFFELDGHYVPLDTCCDRFTYELAVRSGERTHAVRALEATPDTPAAVWEALRAAGQFIAETTR
jgi:hypothetical protein